MHWKEKSVVIIFLRLKNVIYILLQTLLKIIKVNVYILIVKIIIIIILGILRGKS